MKDFRGGDNFLRRSFHLSRRGSVNRFMIRFPFFEIKENAFVGWSKEKCQIVRGAAVDPVTCDKGSHLRGGGINILAQKIANPGCKTGRTALMRNRSGLGSVAGQSRRATSIDGISGQRGEASRSKCQVAPQAFVRVEFGIAVRQIVQDCIGINRSLITSRSHDRPTGHACEFRADGDMTPLAARQYHQSGRPVTRAWCG